MLLQGNLNVLLHQCDSVTIPDTAVKNNHNYLLIVKILNTDNPHI